MKKYTKLFAAGMALMLAVSAAGCGMQKKEEEHIVGGWEAAQDGTITDELRAIFDKAMEGLVGVEYTPIELLETQIVAGTNYKFLCEGKAVTPDAETKQYIVTIYADLEGGAEVLEIEETGDAEAVTGSLGSENAETLDGGWEAAQDGTVTDELKAIFDKAMEDLVGMNYTPIELLETQVVAGTNYKFLCEGTPVTLGAEAKQYIVTVYADLEGGAEILEITEADGGEEKAGFQPGNPFTDAATMEEAEQGAGFEAEFPETVEGYEGMQISYMEGVMIQAVYGEGDHTLFVRKAKGTDDVSGDYTEYPSVEEKEAGDVTVTLRSTEAGVCTVTWTDGEYSYAFLADQAMTEEEALALAEMIR